MATASEIQFAERLKREGWLPASKAREAKAVIRDLLESYLATFGGNKDALAFRAEKILED